MAWRFTRQQYYHFFLDADANRDGQISMKELRAILKESDYRGSDSDINVMFHVTDLDSDNYISLDEYMIAMGQQPGKAHVLAAILRIFGRNDKNKDGRVDKQEFELAHKELAHAVTNVELQRVDDMIDDDDKKDFDYVEFCKQLDVVWDRKELLDAFWRKADTDKDGFLTLKELSKALKDEGYEAKEIEARFKAMDHDGDGQISYEEYLQAMGEVPTHVHRGALLRKVFHSYDRDNSGTINQQELKAACKEFGKLFSDVQLRQIMDTADADKSGELEYEEFVESIESILGAQDAYEKFFRDADDDNNGYLTVNELVSALKKGGYKGSDAQIKAMFNATDLSGDARITVDEYLIAMGRAPLGAHRTAFMRKVFHEFDTNGDGKVDKKEMKAIFKEMGRTISSREMARISELVDKNSSGNGLDYEAFMQIWEKMGIK